MALESGKIRTELVWTDKRKSLEKLPTLSFQTVEMINEPRKKTMELYMPIEENEYNQLIWGDNKFVMNSLLKDFEGKINLIYIDPPFATGADFSMPIRINGEKFVKEPSGIEIKAYRDTWGKGLSSYLQMMYDRLILMKKLLAENGSIFIHMDWHVGHYIKILLDEIFGKDNFRNEIIVRRTAKHTAFQFDKLTSLQVANDVIFVYAKSDITKFNAPMKEATERQKKGSWHMLYNRANRPTMRYPLLGKVINNGQWMWRKERAFVAVENYKEYFQKHSSKISLKEYWEKTGKKLEFVRANTRTGNPEYFVLPKEKVTSDTSWIDIQAYSFRYRFPSEKSEVLIERIIEMATDKGDLVSDFFSGSGTTLAVAEKLGRSWIGCDLSKYAIHVTRKRLLDILGCKPFKIRNLGFYQKHKLRENGVSNYTDFVLRLYEASPISGYSHIHGRKGRRLIHIGAPDSFVTERSIKRALQDCRSANSTGLDVLGWEFEMGLYELIEEIGEEYGVNVKLKQIPTDVLDMKKRELTKIKFFDMNYLNLDLIVKGRNATIKIKRFAIANPEYLPEKIKESFKDFRSYIDYWAVDFDYKDDIFHNMRQDYRTRKNKDIKTRISYNYENSGKYDILVKVVDIFGNDTNKILHARVK